MGGLLGSEGVNINWMSVAPVSEGVEGMETGEGNQSKAIVGREKEALMILGVDREVGREVTGRMVGEGGVVSVSVVAL